MTMATARENAMKFRHEFDLFDDSIPRDRKLGLRAFADTLTIDINQKGVLDIDTVKGCAAGIGAHGPKGCYQACYAANIAKFRGFDFSQAITRTLKNKAQARAIERAVKASPLGFFRIGTMGDPCHAWEHTISVIEWLAPFAVPVIITKHWWRASDDQIRRLVATGTILNTSVSALDSDVHLARRLSEIERYRFAGGTSVARVVSCDWNTDDPIGAAKDRVQQRLFALVPMIDNPLRTTSTHPLVRAGVMRLRKVKDLAGERTVSIATGSKTYLGHCGGCSDLCGLGLLAKRDARPDSPQFQMFQGEQTDG